MPEGERKEHTRALSGFSHLHWAHFLPGVWGSSFLGLEIAFTEEGGMSSKFELQPILHLETQVHMN